MSTPSPEVEHVLATLRDFGVEVDDVDAAVINATIEQFRPHRDALIEADLNGVAHELDFEPSRPPSS